MAAVGDVSPGNVLLVSMAEQQDCGLRAVLSDVGLGKAVASALGEAAADVDGSMILGDRAYSYL